MNKVVDTLVSKGVVCKTLLHINTSELHSRKKMACFLGVDEKARYIGVWQRFSKGRLGEDEAYHFLFLLEKLEKLKKHRILKNFIIIKSPISLKADKLLREKGWRILSVLM